MSEAAPSRNPELPAKFNRLLLAGIAVLALADPATVQTPAISGIKNAAPRVAATGNLARGEPIGIDGSNLANGVSLAQTVAG